MLPGGCWKLLALCRAAVLRWGLTSCCKLAQSPSLSRFLLLAAVSARAKYLLPGLGVTPAKVVVVCVATTSAALAAESDGERLRARLLGEALLLKLR